MFRNMKIATKLLLIGGLMTLIPLLIIGLISLNLAGAGLREAADEQLRTRSAEIAKRVNDVMSDQLRFVTALTVTPDIRRAAAVVADNQEGAAGDLERASRYLEKLLQSGDLRKAVQLFGLVNMNGTIVAASHKSYIGVRIPDRQYFQKARAGKPTIGEVAINKVTGKPFISFAAPVKTDDGRVVGVVNGIVDIAFLNHLISSENIGESGYAYIIDETGLLIAHPNPDHLMKTNLSDQAGMKTIVRQMKAGKAGVEHYMFEGIDKTCGFAPVAATGWSVGLTLPDDEYLAPVTRITIFVAVAIVVSMLVVLAVLFVFAMSISKRLKRGVNFAEEMAAGDLTGHLDVMQNDEIGVVVRSLNHMVDNLSGMIRKIHSNASSLFVTSSELRNISEVLSTSSGNTADKASTVAAAAEEMNANIESMAAAMEEASASVNNIAAAVEEMNTNFNDITGRIHKTRESTSHAAEISAGSSEQVNELSKAATEIAGITETIYAIADKTSLLALNATIEAARAGDAGKGFAVVAGEIKVLAQQVSESTGDISKKISAIQSSTERAIDGIKEIVGVIRDVDDSVESITTSMQQQNDATKEIAENINQTSTGIREINENVSQSSQAVSQVTTEISNLNQSATEISQSSRQVERSADYLIDIAEQLAKKVADFKFNESGFSSGPVKLAHATWKKKLSDLLAGHATLSVEDITSHRECDFGQWYYGKGMEHFKNNKIFMEIDGGHEKVHSTAKEITRLYNDGKVDEAGRRFREFNEMTDQLFGLLDKLEEEADQ